MPTDKQKLGIFGEELIVKNCICPKCKKKRTLKKLPTNFKCADLICDFCGFLAQVKSSNVKNIIIKTNQKIKFNLLYDQNRSLQKKIKLEQLRKETS